MSAHTGVEPFQSADAPLESNLLVAIGIVGLIAGILGLLLTYGLFTLKTWAWLGTMILQWLAVFGNLGNFLNPSAYRGEAVIFLMINFVTIYYLFRPEVRRVFGRG